MKIFVPIAKVDDEQRLVYGYATTEALDAHGEVVKREAIEAALPHYMRFANIREMHQLSAVGVTQEADLDAKGLRLKAKVVDDEAWAKVKEGVYKGLSIGGLVTKRDPADRSIITGVELNEISLVDRPANPEALIEAYKVWGEPTQKIGARNSKADLERIQAMHDTAVALGARCPSSDDTGDATGDGDGADGGSDDDGDDDALAAIASRSNSRELLRKLARMTSRMEALAQRVEEQGRLLRKLADEPAAPKYLAGRAIEKSADGAPIAAEDEPKTALDAIKKAHRHPIRLGLG